jgi:hypothetical protein
MSQARGAAALHGALSALRGPGAGRSGEEARDFSRALQEITMEQGNLGHDWGFDARQIQTLGDYYAASLLLAACLDVAYESNRPPGAWRAEGWVG